MDLIATLIVCEKPDAAGRVARALDHDSDPRRSESHGVPYYECRRGKETLFICSALGHLYAVDSKTNTSRRYYPVWDYEWKPKNLINKESAKLSRWVQTINNLAKNCDRFINACDYDVEGSLIGYTILRYICNNAHTNAQRMKFSTMTEKELTSAYTTRSPRLDFSQAEAGRCRHELDWLYGINLSRLLTESALKQHRGYSTLSAGRVQGPTLKFVVEREKELQCFAPTPYWTIDATISHDNETYDIDFEKDKILVLAEARKVVSDCQNTQLEVIDVESRTIQQSPPYPFDLATLQSEAYRHFGYTPSRTLALAERLYLEAVISYPRTSSQKLPPDIGYHEILDAIARKTQYGPLGRKLASQAGVRPNEGSKQDPAHPAIYPTGESPKRTLTQQESNILDLIIRRFMSTFAEPSIRTNTELTLTNNLYHFVLRGSNLIREGWIEYYRPYVRDDSQKLPGLKIGDKVAVKSIVCAEKFTEPPPRYNPGSLLRKMEDENIGTKATRAGIIDILYKRGYIKENRIQATPLATEIITILDRHCPLITDSKFTAQLESLMETIQSEQITESEVVARTLEQLRPIMLSLISKEEEIGAQLSKLVVTDRISRISFTYPCPSCRSKLMVIRSRASRKRFIGCTGYKNGCRFTLPLPQFGTLTILSRNCKACGFQLISVRSRGRHALTSCPRCYASKSTEKSRKTNSLLEISPLV